MNTVIIEDERMAVENLENLLLKIDRNIHIQARMDSVEDSVIWLRENSTDLLFLDIHLADDLSFKIFQQVDIDIPVIFTTAYNQYAIKAFKLNSIDYLLKPIDENELRQAIDKFKKLQSQPKIDFKSLIDAVQGKKIDYQKRFMVTTGEKVKSILVEEIAYFFAEGRYIFLTSKDNRQYIIDYTLDKLEELLNPDEFFRVNRQFLVSFSAIQEMYAYPKGRIKTVLKPAYTKEEVIVSLSKSVEFRKWLNR